MDDGCWAKGGGNKRNTWLGLLQYIPDLVCTREEAIYTRYQVITTVWIETVRRVTACMSVR